jgi:hypothetical protein
MPKMPEDSRLRDPNRFTKDGRYVRNMQPFYCSNCGKYQGRVAGTIEDFIFICDDCVRRCGEPPLTRMQVKNSQIEKA